MDGFNTFDLIILSITLLLGLKGIINGLLKELFGLIGVIGGIFVASRYATDVGEFINQNLFKFQNEAAISITGFVIGFGLFWIGAILVGKFFTTLSSASGLGGINRIFGFVIGSGKIFLIFSIIAYAISNVEVIKKNSAKYLENSEVYPLLIETGKYIVKLDTIEIGTKSESSTNDSIKEENSPQVAKNPLIENVQAEMKNIEEKITNTIKEEVISKIEVNSTN